MLEQPEHIHPETDTLHDTSDPIWSSDLCDMVRCTFHLLTPEARQSNIEEARRRIAHGKKRG